MLLEPLAKYAYLNAKIRGKMSRLLAADQLRGLAGGPDLEHSIGLLKETPYSRIVERLRSPGDLLELEKAFFLEEVMTYRDIRMRSKGPVADLIKILESWYELEEVKIALRVWVRNINGFPAEYTPSSGITKISLEDIPHADSLDQVMLILKGTPYGAAIASAVQRFEAEKISFHLEVALDQDYYRRLWLAVEELSRRDREVAQRIIGIEVDLKNLQWMLRGLLYYKIPAAELVNYMIPHGWRFQESVARLALEKTEVSEVLEMLSLGPYKELFTVWAGRAPRESAALMEGVLGEILMRDLRLALAGFPFTIGTLLAYCLLKKIEIQNITKILEGVYFGLSQDEIMQNTLGVA